MSEHLRWIETCDAEVSRRGESQPCDKTAVAMAYGEGEDDRPWAVCPHHARGRRIVPLTQIKAWADAELREHLRRANFALVCSERARVSAEAQVAAVRALAEKWDARTGDDYRYARAILTALSSSEEAPALPTSSQTSGAGCTEPVSATAEQNIPRDILTTLFRALVHVQPGQITREQKEQAWAWLEKRNHYEEMGQ